MLIGLGLVGLVLPVMPGWLLIIPGLSLWAGEFVWAARLRDGARSRLRRVMSQDPESPERKNRAA
ncbi:MAG: PGPGW domain-containing protein [Actinomycetota bacterium]